MKKNSNDEIKILLFGMSIIFGITIVLNSIAWIIF